MFIAIKCCVLKKKKKMYMYIFYYFLCKQNVWFPLISLKTHTYFSTLRL